MVLAEPAPKPVCIVGRWVAKIGDLESLDSHSMSPWPDSPHCLGSSFFPMTKTCWMVFKSVIFTFGV